MKLIRLILKNWKILTRNKITFSVVTFGPLLIILLAGIAFNNSLSEEIKIGVFSDEYSDVSETFISDLREEFEIVKFENVEECISAVEIKGFHSCIEIPPNLDIGQGHTLTFYIDISRANIASSIQQRVVESLYDTTQGISEDLTKNLIETISLTEENIVENSDRVNKERENIRSIAKDLKDSLDLSQEMNLNFDLNATQVGELLNKLELVKNTSENIKDSAKRSLNLIESSGNNDSSTNKAKEELDDLYDNSKDNLEEVKNVKNISSNLSTNLEELNLRLGNARSNRYAILNNFYDMNSDLDTNKKELTLVAESFNEILLSIETNEFREAQAIVQPVAIKEEHIITGSKIQLLFPSLIMLVIMLVTMMMGSSQVIFEKTNKAAKRMAMAPINKLTQVASIFSTTFLISLCQVTVILIITFFVFKIQLNLLTLFILILSAIFFILVGMAVGYTFKTENGSLLGTLSVASVFFIVSDLILPLESMGPLMMKVVEFFPFVLVTNILRKNMFFSPGIIELLSGIAILLAYIIIIIAAFTIYSIAHPKLKVNKINKQNNTSKKQQHF